MFNKFDKLMNEDLARKNTKHLISAQTLIGKTKDQTGKGVNDSIFVRGLEHSTRAGLLILCFGS